MKLSISASLVFTTAVRSLLLHVNPPSRSVSTATLFRVLYTRRLVHKKQKLPISNRWLDFPYKPF